MKARFSEFIDGLLESRLDDASESFMVVDLQDVRAKHALWTSKLPTITPYYALKCNPDRKILDVMINELGMSFDCASAAELDLVLEVGPERIIFANPSKSVSHLKYAREKNVKRMTFDNVFELEKIAQHFPEAELVLRLATDDNKSICQFSKKFGAPMSQVEDILARVHALGLKMIGTSFHVGSGACSLSAYTTALNDCRTVFDICAKKYGVQLTLLDIGGGFPGSDDSGYQSLSFSEIADHLNAVLPKAFEGVDGLTVIAEPGRYYVASSYVLVTPVVSKRLVGTHMHYFIGEGVYGSFNCKIFDHFDPGFKVLRKQRLGNTKVFTTTIWGPTCDSMDKVADGLEQEELDIGDWLYFPNMGSYTLAAGSKFNGFECKVYYIPDNVTAPHLVGCKRIRTATP